ncbi:hypothetical protein [Rhodococcus sp. YH3-3]|uniref:hypothetical protein n=1 Tax=Rhodococcus sp. YH3-3 TaxID=1803579 RepID=UPI00187D0E87|nr:hypothetical protein [Rhodococcus sp. YH3-3]
MPVSARKSSSLYSADGPDSKARDYVARRALDVDGEAAELLAHPPAPSHRRAY